MKKWIVLSLLVSLVAAVQAAPQEGKKDKGGKGSVNKEQWMKQQQKTAEKQGKEFDAAKAEKKFNQMDKNKDGKISADEKKKGGKGKGKEKGKGEGKKNKDKKSAE